MAARGSRPTNRIVPVAPSGEPDNIERIATNVRIDGYDTIHRGAHDTLTPACGTWALDHKLILTTAERTCRRPGCSS
jgi:hypothetical protein